MSRLRSLSDLLRQVRNQGTVRSTCVTVCRQARLGVTSTGASRFKTFHFFFPPPFSTACRIASVTYPLTVVFAAAAAIFMAVCSSSGIAISTRFIFGASAVFCVDFSAMRRR